MQTRIIPRRMTLADIEAHRRRDWPAGVIACPVCDGHRAVTVGFANGMPVEADCERCAGFGYLYPLTHHGAGHSE